MAKKKKDNRPRKEKSESIGVDALRASFGLGKLEENEHTSKGGAAKYTSGSKSKSSGQKPSKGAGNASAAAEKILYNAEAPYTVMSVFWPIASRPDHAAPTCSGYGFVCFGSQSVYQGHGI